MAIWSRVISIRWEKLIRNAKSSPACDTLAPANEGPLCQYCDTLPQGTCYHCGAAACPRHSVLGVMVGLYVRGRLCNLCFRRIGEVCSIDDVTSGDEALGIQEDDPEGKGCSPCPVRDNYHEAEERDAGAATTPDPRESTSQRRCQCPRRCGCDCIEFDCCGTEEPAEDCPASQTPLPQGSRRVLRVEHF